MPDHYTKAVIDIPINRTTFKTIVKIPHNPQGVVLFGHIDGGGIRLPQDNLVASTIRQAEVATLFFNLLTEEESQEEEKQLDLELLTSRYLGVINWLKKEPALKTLPIGLYGKNTGVAAVINTAITLRSKIKAMVSQSGRPDLVEEMLDQLKTPILLIVGEKDAKGIEINQTAYKQITTTKKLEIIPEVGENFEGRENLQKVADLAKDWYGKYLVRKSHKNKVKGFHLER